MLLFGDNDSHVNETTAKQECSLSLFGPIFLMFQHSLICWQKCLGPLTAKVTESTTHPADSKQGIWGMAFKQWLSHKPFCLQMLWKAYRLMIFFLGLQQFESPASLPKSPAPSRLGLQLFYLPFQPHSCGIGYAGVFPTNESFQGFILFICIDRHCPNTGQGDALCPAGQVSGFNFARGTLHVGSSLTVLWVNRENWTSGREINGNCQKKKKKKSEVLITTCEACILLAWLWWRGDDMGAPPCFLLRSLVGLVPLYPAAWMASDIPPFSRGRWPQARRGCRFLFIWSSLENTTLKIKPMPWCQSHLSSMCFSQAELFLAELEAAPSRDVKSNVLQTLLLSPHHLPCKLLLPAL